MLEPTKNTSTIQQAADSSKPIEIYDSISEFQSSINSCEQQNSLSAYASAESSPSSEYKCLTGIDDDLCFSRTNTSNSLNTYWGLPPATSLLIDEEDKLDALEHSREKMSMSQSFNTSKEFSDMVDLKEYKSLPASHHHHFSVTCLDKTLEETETDTEVPAPGQLKKELSESDIFKLNVVEGEEDLIRVDLQENASLKTDQLPEMSIPRSKSSTMSFIEKIFSSGKKAEGLVEQTNKLLSVEPSLDGDYTSLEPCKSSLPISVISAASFSASSPNPECSPYKFLLNETPHNNNTNSSCQVTTTTTTTTTTTALSSLSSCKQISASSFSSASSLLHQPEIKKKEENKVIENLASLNRKDSEEHDPILSSAACVTNTITNTFKNNIETNFCHQINKTDKSVLKSMSPPVKSSSKTGEVTSSSSQKVDNLPASSREFTMNFNFNLASAAAATASGPVVVVDNSMVAINVNKEHDKFTSNASTSSIHNDLKMILEEGKENESGGGCVVEKKGSGKNGAKSKVKESKTEDKLNKSKELKPKAPRIKKEKKENVSTNASFNSSANTDSMTTTTESTTGLNVSNGSKSGDQNLIKMLMSMVESNKKNTSINNTNSKTGNKKIEGEKKLHTKHHQVGENDGGVGEDGRPSLIQMTKQNGRFKYNKEFLEQIRDQRSEFIDQIQPEIFKAYCYCMNGKYWDPEKYFDIVQFPGEFDKSNYSRNNSYNRSASYNKSTNNNTKYNGNKMNKHTPNTTFNNNNNNSYNSRSMGTTPVTFNSNYISSNHPDDSPQPLQVPRNSPKFFEVKTKNDQILESLGIMSGSMDKQQERLEAEKILLGLINKDKIEQSQSVISSNLMNILKKKSSAPSSSQSPHNTILDNLFTHNQPQQPILHAAVVVPQPQITTSRSAYSSSYPLIMTAQELEMSQLNEENLARCKLPNEISMNKLEELQQSMESNDSFAYRQLVKNLSNHPLTAATNNNVSSSNNSLLGNKLENSLSKLQAKRSLIENSDNSKPNWQVSNDGTSMLKQLLNLKDHQHNHISETAKPKKQQHHNQQQQQYNKKATHGGKVTNNNNNKSHGSSVGSSSSAGSSPMNDSGSNNKFPVANPHEKPQFEAYMAEENRKQIESVVASALSKVLCGSPMSSSNSPHDSMSPTQKSPIEDLINKINLQQKQQDLKNIQHEHFNSLLNKINIQQQARQQQDDILKWFSDASKNRNNNNNSNNSMSAHSLSEIEFMAMNKLF